MKYLSVILLLGIFLNTAFAQKKYVDPNERQKRGLMEDGDAPSKPAPTIEEKIEKNKVAESQNSVTPQESLCECRKLKDMNEGLSRLYWNSDEVTRAMTGREEIDARDSSVQATMIYIVSTSRGSGSPANPAKCKATDIFETNMKKLTAMIHAQEQKCDVYKLRGIDHD